MIKKNFFDQLVKSSIKTYDSIQKFETGQGDIYKTGCLLDYNYFQNYYNMIGKVMIQKQCNKLILLQQCFSLLRKQKKPL